MHTHTHTHMHTHTLATANQQSEIAFCIISILHEQKLKDYTHKLYDAADKHSDRVY